jgi:hypothetical protein
VAPNDNSHLCTGVALAGIRGARTLRRTLRAASRIPFRGSRARLSRRPSSGLFIRDFARKLLSRIAERGSVVTDPDIPRHNCHERGSFTQRRGSRQMHRVQGTYGPYWKWLLARVSISLVTPTMYVRLENLWMLSRAARCCGNVILPESRGAKHGAVRFRS